MKVGDRLQGYEILGEVGAGAMGQVYRARDSRLGREVAIKVLPPDVTANPRRRLRFEREARTLAALNHPNIATLHEAGHDPNGDVTFLVMELVAGEDLSTRLARGRVPLAAALAIARQLASALAAAHDAGVVHRDLKPGNIKLRPDDTVKVIDFGLARRAEAEDVETAPGVRGDASLADEDVPAVTQPSVTVTIGAGRTEDGAILGSAAYMAPEQARGEPVDRRADIWAFGVVLFEMLSGRRPFEAPDTAETLAAVVSQEPEWAALPAETPTSIRRLLARCLTKDRRQRLHDINDARLEVDEVLTPTLPAEAKDVLRHGWRARALWLTVSASLGVAAGAAMWWPRDPAARVIHAQIQVSPAEELNAGGRHPSMVLPAGGARTALEWSTNGKALAFIGVQAGIRRVYLRDLSNGDAQPIAGTDGANLFTFSPDGESIAFWADGAIKRVAVRGGPVVEVFQITDLHGLAWGPTRMILSDGELASIPATGARVEGKKPLSAREDLVRHATPFLLPDESAVLFTEYSRQWTSGDERVMVLPLVAGGTPKLVLRDAADARYMPSGHLAFLRRGTLFVVPFDVRALETRGEPVALVTNVSQAVEAWDSWDLTLAGQFAISRDGSLANVSAPLPRYPDHELVAADRAGRIARIAGPARAYRSRLAISPDGDRIGVSVQTPAGLQLHTLDLARGTLTRIAESLPGEPMLVDWSRTGELAVGVVDGGKISSAIVRPDAGSAIRTIPDSNGFWPASLSATGRLASMGHADIWVFAADGSQPPAPLARTQATETQPAWSPDGRWIAYTSDISGHLEVYRRPYPGPGDAVMISVAGGSSPAWHANGRELFYVESDQSEDRLMSVAIDAAGQVSPPRRLFATPRDAFFRSGSVFTPYAVTADGARFLALRLTPRRAAPVTELHVVLNWIEDVRARLGR